MSDLSSRERGAGEERRSEALSWYGEPLDDVVDELVGTILSGTYEVTRVLGEGAMGRVYEAHHRRISIKRYAIKILHPEFRRHPDALRRFQREAEAAAGISHPHVVGVYDVDVAPDGRPFIVCEYLEGVDLGRRLEELGKLDVQSAVRIMHQVCDGLSEAHACGVIHRDVKPENVYLVGNCAAPVAKVLDFGLSRVEGPGASITQAGTVMGTPSYMPPEQARGARVDERADVYGVGAILYHALTGRRPFDKGEVTATLGAVLTEEPPRPRSLEATIPEGLEAVIQRAMAKAPEDRYASPGELSSALHACSSSEGTADEGRRRLATSDTIEVMPIRARFARASLATMAVLGFLWLFGVMLSGTTSLVLWILDGTTGRVPSGTELLIVSVAMLGAMATPLIVAIRHVRRHVWPDTNRVVKLRDGLRSIVLVSMAAYAAAALAVRLYDGAVGGLLPGGGSADPTGTSWTLWSAAFLVVSLMAAAAAILSRHWLGGAGRSPSRLRQVLAGPVLATSALVLGAAVLYGGLVARTVSPPDKQVARPVAHDPEAPPETSPPPTAAASATATAAPIERASATELEAAIRQGPTALRRLADRHPQDRAVMRAVVAAYADDEATWLSGLEWAEKLVSAHPSEAAWQTLRMLVLRAAQEDEPLATRAFDLMASSLGPHGPDLLFDLMLAGTNAAKERARRALGRQEVRATASPAVRISYDLKTAHSCEEVLELLDEANRDGDGRTVAVLSLIGDGSRKGCGPAGRRPCPAKCDGAARTRLREVRAAIRERG